MTRPEGRQAYVRGFIAMVLILAVSLLALSIALWSDPQESASFLSVVLNNGLALFLLALLPAIGLSALHTRLLASGDQRSGAKRRTLSTAYGIALGGLLALLLSLLVLSAVPSESWTLILWGTLMGAVYGLIRSGQSTPHRPQGEAARSAR